MVVDLNQIDHTSSDLVAPMPEGVTLHEVRVGMHEAGHALVADALDLRVVYAKMQRTLFSSTVTGGVTRTQDWLGSDDDDGDGDGNIYDRIVQVMLAGNEAGAHAMVHYLGWDVDQARECENPGSENDFAQARAHQKQALNPEKILQRHVEQLVRVNRRAVVRLGVRLAQRNRLSGNAFKGKATTT